MGAPQCPTTGFKPHRQDLKPGAPGSPRGASTCSTLPHPGAPSSSPDPHTLISPHCEGRRSCYEHIHTTDYGSIRRASRGNYNLKVACREGRWCSLQKSKSPEWTSPYPGTLLGAGQVGRAYGPRWLTVSWFLEVLITIFLFLPYQLGGRSCSFLSSWLWWSNYFHKLCNFYILKITLSLIILWDRGGIVLLL